MNHENNFLIRRQLLDWRDKHIENIHNHLKREMVSLFEEMDQAINNISIKDLHNSKAFTQKHLEPVYTVWVQNEVTVLLNDAQRDLNNIYKHAIEYQKINNNLKPQNDTKTIQDAATALMSTGAALAAIPSIISLSTTTVSAGGLLGLLGVTTTVVSWPIVVTGALVAGSLFAFGSNKAATIKSDAINRYKRKVKSFLVEQIIHNDAKDSVCQRLQVLIEDTANSLISELNT